ncbi:hypothetical protein QYE76_072043 [Lolium multiflorum]|uniref:RNA-dependent RNA polymerase n=1 Tax=Lolium multiflorum TaxID=4521 RepID=A0AAD8PSV5_LOLMU|nr:hypothetical protein QYE76_072043 [Lolium multiflorum]
MDRLLTSEVEENKTEWELIKDKMLKLVDIYYDALDAPKTGNKITIPGYLRVKIYPHFMERKGYTVPPYHSTSVLGKIYDEAESQQSETVPPSKISPLTCFTEEEVTEERKIWGPRYQEYLKLSSPLCDVNRKPPISKEEKNMRFQELFKHYKQMLYEAVELEESQRNRFVVFKEACAIYQIVYEKALQKDDVGKCGFAWKVAGRALCQFYVIKCGGETALVNMQVVREAFKRGA